MCNIFTPQSCGISNPPGSELNMKEIP